MHAFKLIPGLKMHVPESLMHKICKYTAYATVFT